MHIIPPYKSPNKPREFSSLPTHQALGIVLVQNTLHLMLYVVQGRPPNKKSAGRLVIAFLDAHLLSLSRFAALILMVIASIAGQPPNSYMNPDYKSSPRRKYALWSVLGYKFTDEWKNTQELGFVNSL